LSDSLTWKKEHKERNNGLVAQNRELSKQMEQNKRARNYELAAQKETSVQTNRAISKRL
jgi:hypothetical protein